MGRIISRFDIKLCEKCGSLVEVDCISRGCPCGSSELSNIEIIKKEKRQEYIPYNETKNEDKG